MDQRTRVAFERLLTIAHSDTGQARRVADFILAWWNPYSLGRFDITDVFTLDRAIAQDMATVFSYMANLSNAEHPVEYRAEIEKLIAFWRPDVWEQSKATA